MRAKTFAAALTVIALAAPALAEVKAAAADGMILQFKGELPLAREAAWKRVIAIGSWWNGAHSYSGMASNIKIDPKAGGCWCEKWPGGQVEHGRVIMVMPKETLRFAAGLGPLQDTGVNAALTITLADGASPGTTSVTWDYKVVGSSLTNLAPMAPLVDGVLQEQFDRLIKPK
jgi:uncharacterized protein YndB with AHSA1/START domain